MNQKKKSWYELSEEEQLAAAIAESLSKEIEESEIKKRKIDTTEDTVIINSENKTAQETVIINSENKIAQETNSQITDNTLPESIGDCVLQIRLPEGNMIQLTQYSATDRINTVYNYINEKIAKKKPFQLLSNFPRKIYEGEALNLTLKEAQLAPRAVLLLKYI